MIVDASVGIKWLVPEEDSAAAAELVGTFDLIVPTLFHCETGNALWKKAARGEILLADVLPHLGDLPSLVRTVDETALIRRAVELASVLAHPVYDCIYLALAESMDDVVVTADRRFLTTIEASEFNKRVKGLDG
ncbi:type II toxin-antitoxin system VapC family toxin [Allosphingosinicella humi]